MSVSVDVYGSGLHFQEKYSYSKIENTCVNVKMQVQWRFLWGKGQRFCDDILKQSKPIQGSFLKTKDKNAL